MRKNQNKRFNMSSYSEPPQILLETANFHGGNTEEIFQAIDTFSQLDYPHLGMKFHAFDPELVSLPEFFAHEQTKSFYIEEEDWRGVIQHADKKGLKVWLDLFCVYGVRILAGNLSIISGIKFQPSVLDNLEIRKALERVSVENLELIINITGLELPVAEEYLDQMSVFPFKNIILQMGFQNFPASAEDSSLEKIEKIKSHFPEYSLGYADHLDGTSDLARRFPVYAFLKGCTYLEKHICNRRIETRYDFQSALEFPEMEEMAGEIKTVHRSLTAGFLPKTERDYLQMTYQKPILKVPLSTGQLVAESDLVFRRTDKPGLKLKEWCNLQQNFHILAKDVSKGNTLSTDLFRRAKIGVVIAARMKSSRLPNKATLPIAGIPSIQRCLQNCLKFPHVDEVIMATSTEKEDAVLADYTLEGQVKLWRGDPVDVLSRYVGACQEYRINVVIRVTGDSPVVSSEIAEFLLRSHFSSGADFTRARAFAIGTNCEIYNTEALVRTFQMVGRAEHSEHMSLYVLNNPEIFKVNLADLPSQWIRDYRLTLDYMEDLEMFQALFRVLNKEELDASLTNILGVLDRNPSIPKMNSHKTLVYECDSELRAELDRRTRLDKSKIDKWMNEKGVSERFK